MEEMLVIILICTAIAAAIFYFNKAPQDAGGQSERKGSNERAEKNGADGLPIVTQKPPEPANLCKAMDSLMTASVRNKIEKLEPIKDASAAAEEAEKKEQVAPPPQDLTNAEKLKEEPKPEEPKPAETKIPEEAPKTAEPPSTDTKAAPESTGTAVGQSEPPKDTSAGGMLVYDHYARRIGRAGGIETSSTNTAAVPTPATSPKIDSPSKDVITAREIKSLREALNTDGGESKDVKTCNEIKTDDVTSSKDVATAQLIPEGGATPDAPTAQPPAQAAPPPGYTSNQTPSTPSGAGTSNGEPSTPAEREKQPEKPKKRKKKNKKSKSKGTDVEDERKSEDGEKKSKDKKKKKKKSKSKNKDAPAAAPPQDGEKQSGPVDGQAKKVAQ